MNPGAVERSCYLTNREQSRQVFFKKFPPAKPLERFVNYFWILRQDSLPLREERFLPNGHFELILDTAAEVEQTDMDGIRRNRPRCFLAGLYDKHFFVKPQGRVHSMGILFRPGAIRHFVNIPLDELKGKPFSARHIFGKSGGLLFHTICDQNTDEDRIHTLESFVLSHYRKKCYLEGIEKIVDYIVQERGCVEVNEIALRTGFTPRHFRREFLKEVGFSPKTFARIVRIDQIMKFRAWNKHFSLTEIAQQFGYFDQAHFIHDFKSVAGATPSEFFDEAHTINTQFD